MKALILSAGFGTRLRPLTDNIPKVMVPINGKTCLGHHIENLRSQGVVDIVINTHHKPDGIKNYFKDGVRFDVNIRYSDEENLLGTSGALHNFSHFDDTFCVVYGDVLANFKIAPALEIHKRNNSLATIVLDERDDKKDKGFVITEGEKVISMIEKPDSPIPNALINSGFYILEPSIYNHIPRGNSDFAKDVFPDLIKKGSVHASVHNGYLFDIGTPEKLREAESYMKNTP